jgi:UDP-3-O-[3-hydroxymyristoyl] glucosamine N-acyltransferase
LKFTLKNIASFVDGDISGNPNLEIIGVSEIQNGHSGTISFLGNQSYRKYMDSTEASAVIVSDEKYLSGKDGIIVKDPQLAIAKVLSMFFPEEYKPRGIHPNAVIDSSAIIGKNITIESGAVIESGVTISDNTFIGANTFIGEKSKIGSNSKIYQNVVIYHEVHIGNSTTIHASAVIGCDGYGFVKDENGHFKIPQTGNVLIGDNVEIGASSVIDRATIGQTIIGNMTKVDNLVHIGHNVQIGNNCLITAQVGIAGSAKINNNCSFGGQSGVAPHVEIGPKSIIASKSGVTKSLSGGEMYGGFPARPIKEQNKRDAVHSEVLKIKKILNKLITSN